MRRRNERVLYVRAGERGGGVDLAGEYRKIKESGVAKTQEPGLRVLSINNTTAGEPGALKFTSSFLGPEMYFFHLYTSLSEISTNLNVFLTFLKFTKNLHFELDSRCYFFCSFLPMLHVLHKCMQTPFLGMA